jgi:hypothetical protein
MKLCTRARRFRRSDLVPDPLASNQDLVPFFLFDLSRQSACAQRLRSARPSLSAGLYVAAHRMLVLQEKLGVKSLAARANGPPSLMDLQVQT